MCGQQNEHSRCDDNEKPINNRPCPFAATKQRFSTSNQATCPPRYSWFVSPWSPVGLSFFVFTALILILVTKTICFCLQCSVSCGEGRQSRMVACIYSLQGQPLSIIHSVSGLLMCGRNKKKKSLVRKCKALPCMQSRWYVAQWSPVSHPPISSSVFLLLLHLSPIFLRPCSHGTVFLWYWPSWRIVWLTGCNLCACAFAISVLLHGILGVSNLDGLLRNMLKGCDPIRHMCIRLSGRPSLCLGLKWSSLKYTPG